MLAAVVIVGGAGAFVAWNVYDRAADIRTELTDAQRLIPIVTSSAAALDFDGAAAALDEASEHTAQAVALADDPLWRVAAHVPWVGKNIVAVDELALITDDALRAARPLAAAGPALLPANFAPVDGAIPVQPLLDAQPIVHTAAGELTAIEERLDAVDVDGTMDALGAAKTTLADGLGQVTGLLDTADTVLTVAPTLLGAQSPQTYVISFLNNAELRSMGGTALSFVELRVDSGRIEMTRAIPAGFGNFRIGDPIVPVPEGFEQIAPGGFGTFITNAGIRPSMQSLADVVSANWQAQFGYPPDAVISMDVVALSYILRATGAVTSGDWTITADNAVDVLLNEVLNAFDTGNLVRDNMMQDQVYTDLVDETFARVSSGQFDVTTLVEALGEAVSERRLIVWSADLAVEQTLVDAGMDAGIPDRAGEAAVVGIYLNDNVGSKLNYYLDTAVRVDEVCGAALATRVTRGQIDEDSLASVGTAIDSANEQLSALEPVVAEVETARAALTVADDTFAAALSAFTGSIPPFAALLVEDNPAVEVEITDAVTATASAVAAAGLMTATGVSAISPYTDAVATMRDAQELAEDRARGNTNTNGNGSTGGSSGSNGGGSTGETGVEPPVVEPQPEPQPEPEPVPTDPGTPPAAPETGG